MLVHITLYKFYYGQILKIYTYINIILKYIKLHDIIFNNKRIFTL